MYIHVLCDIGAYSEKEPMPKLAKDVRSVRTYLQTDMERDIYGV